METQTTSTGTSGGTLHNKVQPLTPKYSVLQCSEIHAVACNGKYLLALEDWDGPSLYMYPSVGNSYDFSHVAQKRAASISPCGTFIAAAGGGIPTLSTVGSAPRVG